MERSYLAIDLKSFYASVECIERGLDPLGVNLVVADPDRTEKTICLAVSPTLKARGVSSRPRLFEVIATTAAINEERRRSAPGHKLVGSSYFDKELNQDSSLALDYIVAPPRMGLYVDYSTRIYGIYLDFVAKEDIHVYSIDEVFIEITHYMRLYKITPRQLATRILKTVYDATGITATAGIGTNLYLAKVAMDIEAKRMPPDENGTRIAELDEKSYRRLLWSHRPLTDFWRVGAGYSKRLENCGIYTMGDIATVSLVNEDLFYKLFGVNAELLIDHAWGWEPCTIEAIKSYKPASNSISTGQVLQCPYEYSKARLIAMEMCDLLVLDLVERGVLTNQLVLTVGYDASNLSSQDSVFSGQVTLDHYGRLVPKHAHGTVNLPEYTSSTAALMQALTELFERIVDRNCTVRRVNITACNIKSEEECAALRDGVQIDMFSFSSDEEKKRTQQAVNYQREKRRQKAIISIKHKYGKNAILKGMNFEDGGTTVQRNGQIGGHRA